MFNRLFLLLYNFPRVDHETIEDLLLIRRPHIEKMYTAMRKSILVFQGLFITLRYLLSDADFEVLKIRLCITTCTLSTIIVGIGEAVNEIVQNIKVRFQFRNYKIYNLNCMKTFHEFFCSIIFRFGCLIFLLRNWDIIHHRLVRLRDFMDSIGRWSA